MVEVYLRTVAAQSGGKITTVPDHVAVLEAEARKACIIRLPEHAVNAALARHSVRRCAIVFEGSVLGSVTREELIEHSVQDQGSVVVYDSWINANRLYDPAVLDREASLPSPPPSCGSVGMSGLSDEVGGEKPYFLVRPDLHAYINAIEILHSSGVEAHRVLKQRYKAYKKIERFNHDTRVRERKVKLFELASVVETTLFADIPEHLWSLASMIGHWEVRDRLFGVDTWYSEQEARLCTVLHFDQCADLATSGLGGRLVDPPLAAGAPERMHNESEHVWYEVSAIDLANSGSQCLRDRGASDIFVTKGRAFVPHAVVVEDIIPLWIGRVVREHVSLETADDASAEDTVLINEDTTDAPDYDLARVAADLNQTAQSIATKRRDSVAKRAAARMLPTRAPEASADLPDLEDLMSSGTLPPCAWSMEERLQVHEHHLKHPERFQHTGFLLSLNYGFDAVNEHLWKHFAKNGTTRARFDTKYKRRESNSANERALWKDGVRQCEYEYSCEKLRDSKQMKATGSRTGCPFTHYDGPGLAALLSRMAPGAKRDDLEYVVYLASVDRNPAGACAEMFKVTQGRPFGGSEAARPRAPRYYWRDASQDV